MKVRSHVEDTVLIHTINQEYGLDVNHLTFIPLGDSAYSYTVHCSNGERYYAKLFDTRNDKQRKSVQSLDYYLPLTWSLFHESIFTNLTYPIKNRNGGFVTGPYDNGAVLVLFNFITGETLAEAYPFSKNIVDAIAASLADIHFKVTPKIKKELCRRESFDSSFIPELKNRISVLETEKSSHSHIKSLQELLLPRKTEIMDLAVLLQELTSAAGTGSTGFKEHVLCHGD
ncbi:MAG: protein kinaselike protein, partial [Paenibacillus sp.]|nr:protein kinaselike protein [Paenibacillus sp.]